MRSRGTSVYAKRPVSKSTEDLLSLPKWDPLTLDLNNLESPLLRKNRSAEASPTLFEDFGPLCEGNGRDCFAGDFTQKVNKLKEKKYDFDFKEVPFSRSSTRQSCSTVTGFSQDDDGLDSPVKLQKQKMLRGMIIGARQAGKRELINAMFPSLVFDEDTDDQGKTQFDMVMRTVEKENSVNKYQFWLKEPIVDGKYPQCLLDTYYKRCSVFFLMYDADDRSSFYCLDEEVDLLKQADPEREHTLVLIGNKRGGNHVGEVGAREVGFLKEKYEIKLSLEVDVENDLPEELMAFMENFMKEN